MEVEDTIMGEKDKGNKNEKKVGQQEHKTQVSKDVVFGEFNISLKHEEEILNFAAKRNYDGIANICKGYPSLCSNGTLNSISLAKVSGRASELNQKALNVGRQSQWGFEPLPSWKFSHKDSFIKQIESTFGRFKKRSEISRPEKTDLIYMNGEEQFLDRPGLEEQLGSTLVKRCKDRIRKQGQPEKENRNSHPISGIIGCPGAGKTAMLRASYNFLNDDFCDQLESNFSKFEDNYNGNDSESKDDDDDDDDDDDEVEIKEKDVDMKTSKELTNDEKTAIKEQFKNIVCISITYQSGNDVREDVDGHSYVDNEEKQNSGIELHVNTGFLWRVLFEIIDYDDGWDCFCDKLKSFANSGELSCGAVSKILSSASAFEDCAVVLLIDEIYKLQTKRARDVVHTAAKLMSYRKQFVHAIVTCLVQTPFDGFTTASGRPVDMIGCNLFGLKTLVSIFENDIKRIQNENQLPQARKFLSSLFDTMGLPRFVEYFQKACWKNPGQVESIVEEFDSAVKQNYKGVKKRDVKFIKALLSKRKGFAGKSTDVRVSEGYDDTWDSLQVSGYIQIEPDGVYISPIILRSMLDDDSQEIKWILDAGWAISDNYNPKLFEQVFYCNERLIGHVFENQTMSYPEYFNMSESTHRVSSRLKDFRIRVTPLQLIQNVYNIFGNDSSPVTKDEWEAIEKPNTIIHPSNQSHVAIDILIHRVDAEAKQMDNKPRYFPILWMIQNKDYTESGNPIDVVSIVRKIIKEIKKRPKLEKHNVTLIIAGATDSGAQQTNSKKFDDQCEIVVLTGKRMRNHLLPVFRYRALYAQHFYDTR